jgi:hypothetical protein
MAPTSAPLRFFSATLALALASAAPARAQPPVLAPRLQATVRDTGASSPWVFSLTRDRTGRLFIALPQHGVLVYDGSGEPEWLRSASGARVRGGTLSWMADTLAVSGWRRWELFDRRGAHLACRGVGRAPGEFSVQVFPTFPLPGGRVVGEVRPPWSGQGIGIDLVVAHGQEVLRRLALRSPEPASIDVPFPWGGGHWSVDPPFRTRILWSMADDGSGVVMVEQEPPHGPGPQEVRVRRRALDGRSVFDVVLRVPALAVGAEARERQIAEWGHALDPLEGSTIPRDQAAIHDAFRRRVPFPSWHPPVAGVMAGVDGSAWLRLSSNGDTAEWVRLDRSGRERGRVALPLAFHALYADAAGLWVVHPAAPGEARVLVVTGRPPPFRPFVANPPYLDSADLAPPGACTA